MADTHQNLMAAAKPTELPQDPALDELTERGTEAFLDIVRAHPTSSLCWALLAEASLLSNSPVDDVAAYAYARTGYHRGLDALRRAGWRGEGQVPWSHVPNQGFLRCLWALSVAAGRIGEDDEAERCAQFLRDSSEAAWQALSSESIDASATPDDAPATPDEAQQPTAAPDEQELSEQAPLDQQSTVQQDLPQETPPQENQAPDPGRDDSQEEQE